MEETPKRPRLPVRRGPGRPSVGRPSSAELARRLNQARVQLSRERKKNAKEEADEAALLALVPDPNETQTFEEWEKLSPELFQLQLDYLDARDLKIEFFVAGETAEDRTARIYEAILKHDEIDHQQAMERVKKWEKEREEKAKRDKPLPPQPLPLVEDDLPAPVANHALVNSNPSGVRTEAQVLQSVLEKEIDFERQRLLRHNILNGVDL